MTPLTCTIVVPVYGPEHFLTACLAALKWTATCYELILVDNGTGYDMQADCIIRNPMNTGFAHACNQGAGLSVNDVIVFLNVDTETTLDWLVDLMAAFDDPDVAMAGPKIIHPDGNIQTTGIRTWHGNGQAGGEEMKDDSPSRFVDGVTGACMAIRRSVFNELGGFDAGFYNGYDDVDMCLSVKEAGHKIKYVAESTIVHHESATGPERWAKVHENIAYMNQKWGGR